MNMNTKFFMGIDVSKPFFDAALLPVVEHKKGEMVCERFDSSHEGIKLF